MLELLTDLRGEAGQAVRLALLPGRRSMHYATLRRLLRLTGIRQKAQIEQAVIEAYRANAHRPSGEEQAVKALKSLCNRVGDPNACCGATDCAVCRVCAFLSGYCNAIDQAKSRPKEIDGTI